MNKRHCFGFALGTKNTLHVIPMLEIRYLFQKIICNTVSHDIMNKRHCFGFALGTKKHPSCDSCVGNKVFVPENNLQTHFWKKHIHNWGDSALGNSVLFLLKSLSHNLFYDLFILTCIGSFKPSLVIILQILKTTFNFLLLYQSTW